MEPTPFFYRNKVQQWCFKLLVSTCVILFLIDLFLLDRYSYFSKNGGLYGIDGTVIFYSGIGFVGVVLLIGISKILNRLLSVSETYYNDDF